MSSFADTVFTGGHLITLDEAVSTVDSIAVKDGYILAVANRAEIEHYIGRDTEVIALENKCVVPGFIDAHVHFMQTGLNALFLDYSNYDSLSLMLADLKVEAENKEEGEWIYIGKFDDDRFQEQRAPNINELDAVSPDNPVWLNRIDCHSCVINSKALEMLELDHRDFEGVEKDSSNIMTGNMKKQANEIVRKEVMNTITEEERLYAIDRATAIALKSGITTVHCLEGGRIFSDKDVGILLRKWQENPLYLVVFNQTTEVDKVVQKGLARIGGCIVLDGSFGSRTAALLEPYSDDLTTRGELYYSQEEIDQFVMKAQKNGLQVTVHAIGDRAIEQILIAYEHAQQAFPSTDLRHRIEHAELINEDQLRRCNQLNITLSVQSAFEYFWGGPGMYGKRLGPERVKKTNPYRRIIDSGCLAVGGSDSDVTPMNPLLGIHGAVNHSNQAQRLTPLEALKLFTINAAKSVREEHLKGSIEVGKLANLTVLDQNILQVAENKIKDIKIEKTIIDGKVYYQR